MNFLADTPNNKDDLNSDSEEPVTPDRLYMNLRAHSPSPIRKRGSLLDLFNTSNEKGRSMAQTQDHMQGSVAEKPKKKTAKEVDETYEGDIPNTPYSEMPPGWNEIAERNRIAERLFIEKLDF